MQSWLPWLKLQTNFEDHLKRRITACYLLCISLSWEIHYEVPILVKEQSILLMQKYRGHSCIQKNYIITCPTITKNRNQNNTVALYTSPDGLKHYPYWYRNKTFCQTCVISNLFTSQIQIISSHHSSSGKHCRHHNSRNKLKRQGSHRSKPRREHNKQPYKGLLFLHILKSLAPSGCWENKPEESF